MLNNSFIENSDWKMSITQVANFRYESLAVIPYALSV